jgi:hypothetical protein
MEGMPLEKVQYWDVVVSVVGGGARYSFCIGGIKMQKGIPSRFCRQTANFP